MSEIPECALDVAVLRLPLPVASPHVAVGQSCTATARGIPAPLPCCCFRRAARSCHVSADSPSFGSDAAGVGHAPRDDEESLSSVRSPDVGSANALPERIIPARGQVPENLSNSARQESCDVFHNDDAGS